MVKREADWRFPYPDKYITGHYGTLSEYRKARGMQPHSGTDWARPRGTRIPAIAKGTIRLIQYSKVLGWVVVQSAMDKDGKVWYLGYCHMEQKPGYKVGDKLAKGQTVGLIGSEGQSSGPHLHATASKTLKGVFGPTKSKVNLYALIKENLKPATSEQEDKKTKAVVEQGPVEKIIYACPHCKKELC